MHIYNSLVAEHHIPSMDKQEAHPEDPEKSRVQNETIAASIEAAWEENDPENPVNWPLWYKTFIMVIVTLISTVV